MTLQRAVAALGVAGALKYLHELLKSSDLDHDETVQRTYDELRGEVPSDTKLYADHIDDGINPRGKFDDLNCVPDIVVTSGRVNNLIIEVEDARSLDKRQSDALRQLEDFSKKSYRRLLVLPPSDQDDDPVQEFIEKELGRLSGEVYTTVPENVTDFL